MEMQRIRSRKKWNFGTDHAMTPYDDHSEDFNESNRGGWIKSRDRLLGRKKKTLRDHRGGRNKGNL